MHLKNLLNCKKFQKKAADFNNIINTNVKEPQ
jgi:hypothetical protein